MMNGAYLSTLLLIYSEIEDIESSVYCTTSYQFYFYILLYNYVGVVNYLIIFKKDSFWAEVKAFGEKVSTTFYFFELNCDEVYIILPSLSHLLLWES